jgi:hypothetical protein
MASPPSSKNPWLRRWRRTPAAPSTDWADMGTCIGLDASLQRADERPADPPAARPAAEGRTGPAARWWRPFGRGAAVR